jgi:hypothetical protein
MYQPMVQSRKATPSPIVATYSIGENRLPDCSFLVGTCTVRAIRYSLQAEFDLVNLHVTTHLAPSGLSARKCKR